MRLCFGVAHHLPPLQPIHAQWVVNGRVLTGPHPGQLSTTELVKNLTEILGQGKNALQLPFLFFTPPLCTVNVVQP